MKKNTKLIALIIIVMTLMFGNFYILQKTSKLEVGSQVSSIEIENILAETMSYELEDFTQDKIEKTNTIVISVLRETKDSAILSKCNFILGYIDFINNKYSEATEKFNKSISYFKNNTNSEMKARVYYELSRVYIRQKEYKKSEDAFQNSIEICEKEYTKEEIVRLNTWRSSDLYDIPGRKDESVKIMEETLKLAKNINYNEIEDVYLNLGMFYWYEEKEIQSINCKLEALEIANKKKLRNKVVDISSEIGVDYLFTQNYTEAIKYLNKSLEYNLDNSYKDAEVKSYILLNLSEAYIKIEEYENAEKCLKRLETNVKKQKEGSLKQDATTYMYVNRADLETNLNNPLKALSLLDLASKRYKNSSDFNYYDFDIKLLEEYGDAYYKLGEYTKTLEYHKKAQILSNERNLFYYKDLYNERIYLEYKALGDYENAMEYLEKSNELKKQAKHNQEKQYTQYLIEKFETKENLEKISKLELGKTRMKLISLILILIIMIVGLISSLIYKKNKETNRLNKMFKDLSETDCITKIPNRRALEEYLKNNWSTYQKTEMPISFVMIDIDYFKKYNDNYGHVQGDIVLEKVAKCIENSCRESDFLARYGGEEFTLIMLNTGRVQAISLIEKLIKNIYELNIRHEYSDISDRVSLSAGITTAKVGSNKYYKSYIEKSDDALYEAKQKGRNKYVYLE
ncbi:tetratricopeptide repeat-containing diguanylate cyclase [Romboutsia sp.]|uniref:tetratricopeptide repeat-containing diguanylate cyclase n=1 Tax=Romboutsia sp. TaxID=1965302 RepID=UPI003F403661